MTSISFEEWLHASDAERDAYMESWRQAPEEGREIVAAVAELFQRECIYEVDAASADTDDSGWIIHAYINPDDYALLRQRKPGKFLGIPVRFHESRGALSTH